MISNSQLTLVIVLHVVLYTTALFASFYILGDRLDTEHPFSLSKRGQFMIFFGVQAIGFAALMCKGEDIARIVGEKAFPYVFYGLMIVFVVIGMILYNIVPKRWILPLGIAGWITTFSWTFWHFVFHDPSHHLH